MGEELNLYLKQEMVFGNYDIMYPQTTDKKTIRSSFDGDVKLKNISVTMSSGYLKLGSPKRRYQQMNRYCNFEDEIYIQYDKPKKKGYLSTQKVTFVT